MNRRILREILTVSRMIRMYCQNFHSEGDGLCSDCLALGMYAEARTNKCQFGDQKPVCSKCPVHCYKPEKRKEIKTIMRYAGPRMIYKHPVLAIQHIIDKQKSVNKKN